MAWGFYGWLLQEYWKQPGLNTYKLFLAVLDYYKKKTRIMNKGHAFLYIIF